MRRARLEGRHIGRKPLELDRNAILRDRQQGQSLGQLAKSYRVSRATIHRVLREHPQLLPWRSPHEPGSSATWYAAIATTSSNSTLFAVSCPSLTPPCSSRSASSGRSAASSTTSIRWSGALQKASKIAPPKPHKINGRILRIRPFHKVWLLIRTLAV